MSRADATLAPDQRLALSYAPVQHRHAFAVLFEFDKALASAVSAASEPIIGQIRLAWWREMIEAETPQPSSDPLAVGLSAIAKKYAIHPQLVSMVNGWESLLAPLPIATGALETYAQGRGGGLFGSAARLAGNESQAAASAGEGWAFADFAFRCSDRATAELALSLAGMRLEADAKLPGPLRPFTILRRFARRDVARGLDRGSASETPWRLYDAVAAAIQGK